MTQLGANELYTQADSREDESCPQAVSARQVTSSAIWRAIETGGGELVAFLVFTMLARMLVPGDFGAVSIAGAIMTMLQCLLYHGFTDALIQKRDATDVHHRTVMASNLAFAALMIALGLALAMPLGWYLKRPEFPAILSALLPSLLLRALSMPMLASLRRALDFRSVALRTLLGVCVGGVLAVVVAQRGGGYWALVVNQWSYELVGFAVLVWASPVKPWRLRWNRPAWCELLPVALPVMSSAFLSMASRKLDTVALGVYNSNAVIGVYFMVYRLVWAVQVTAQHGLSDVALVILSSINDDPVRYQQGVLRAVRLMAYICACAYGLLAVTGPWLVPWVFGPTWHPATAPLQVAAASSVGGAIVSIAGVILVSSGHANAASRLATGTAFAQLAAVVIAARWGLMSVVWSAGVVQCASIVPALLVLSRQYNLSVRALASEVVPSLGLLAFALWAAHEVRELLDDAGYAQPLASGVFCMLMALAAVPLRRREQALASS